MTAPPRDCPAIGAPILLVLDILMPAADGLELLSRIRKFPEVPCLFLTAKDSVDNNRIEGLAASAG